MQLFQIIFLVSLAQVAEAMYHYPGAAAAAYPMMSMNPATMFSTYIPMGGMLPDGNHYSVDRHGNYMINGLNKPMNSQAFRNYYDTLKFKNKMAQHQQADREAQILNNQYTMGRFRPSPAVPRPSYQPRLNPQNYNRTSLSLK